MTQSDGKFIRRFLLHILPHGFTKIRHYGFLPSRGKQEKLRTYKLGMPLDLMEQIPRLLRSDETPNFHSRKSIFL